MINIPLFHYHLSQLLQLDQIELNNMLIILKLSGSILYYPNNVNLKNYVILKPSIFIDIMITLIYNDKELNNNGKVDFKYLKEQAVAKGFADPVTWNFGKFLVNENGELVATFSPRTTPMSEEILKWFN